MLRPLRERRRDPPPGGSQVKKFGPRGNILASARINSITPRPARAAGAKALLATPVTSFTVETEFCAIRNANTVVHGKLGTVRGYSLQPMQNGIAGGSPC